MRDAVEEYLSHREAPDRWALGRFVVPLARWDELKSVAPASARERIPVSVIAAPADHDRIVVIMKDPQLKVESVECKASSTADASEAARLVAVGLEVFVEPSRLTDFDDMAPVLAQSGAAGKIRTGGVTNEAFPAPHEVLAFLQACLKAGLRFKATAGLHHAVRGEYRLTYEPVPPMGEMFGFLNVAVAAALLWHGRSATTVLRALDERSLEAFEFTDDGLVWRDEKLSRAQVDEVRARFFAGFGSCSFREPMAEIGLQAEPRA